MPALTRSRGASAPVRFAVGQSATCYPCELQASCQPIAAWLDRESVWPGTVSDLSTNGLGLVLGRRFEPGSGLAVELPASEVRCEETLLVKVAQVQSLPGGRWLLTCAFLSELSEDTVLTLVGPEAARTPQRQVTTAASVPMPGAPNPWFGTFLTRVVARSCSLPPRVRLSVLLLAPLGVGASFSGLVRLVRWAAGW